jgi:predicted alpha/beta hydrolase
MDYTEATFPARDGYPLAVSVYTPDTSSEHTVIISGATAVKRNRYHKYAQFLCAQGLTVLSYDYRGIGGSLGGNIRGVPGTMRDWGENDLAGIVAEAAKRFPSSKLVMVGHSVGGQLIGLAENNHLIVALLAVAVQSGYWRLWPWPQQLVLAGLWYVAMPVLTQALSYFPAKALRLGEDLPRGVALEWARWCRHPLYIVDEQGRAIRERFKAFDRPILAYSISDDWMAPRLAVETLMGFYENADVEHRHIRPHDFGITRLGHFGFFREGGREPLWCETIEWIVRH